MTAHSTKFDGMTMNERLYELGMFERFDAAKKARDRGELIAIYVAAGCELESARISADMVLAK